MGIGCVNRQEKAVLFLYLTGDFTPLWCKTSADPQKTHGQQTPKNPMASRPHSSCTSG